MKLDTALIVFTAATATFSAFLVIMSPRNLYAFITSPIVFYFVFISHHPEARHARGKIVLDLIFALILIAIAAYRVYTFSGK